MESYLANCLVKVVVGHIKLPGHFDQTRCKKKLILRLLQTPLSMQAIAMDVCLVALPIVLLLA